MSTHTLSPYALADLFSKMTNRPLFITGKAGTGKTTFLKNLQKATPKAMAVVAPTGVAAINAGGMTIHSFFQLPVRTLIPSAPSYKQLFAEQRLNQRKRNMLYHLELLVIDEISMVRADVLDAIDVVLRKYKLRQDLPFGGVQVIMIGDLFQLSPVVTRDEEHVMATYYDGPYFFHANVMQQLQPLYIELDHVYRQQDNKFINLLNEVRDNRLSEAGKQLLQTRYKPDFVNTEDDFHITLTTHNNIADSINQSELDALNSRKRFFKADIIGTFPENNYPTDVNLVLKEGARVMFIKNDDRTPRRFYNGKIGIVSEVTMKGILVTCEDGDILVERMEWKNILYKEDETTGNIKEEELGSFVQYPLRLAWAVTIHKSQGLTFDRVIIDAERAFAAGQVYVALSRCRTLEGIVLSTPIDKVALKNDQSVINYTNNQPSLEMVSNLLSDSEKDYLKQLLTDLYDFARQESLVNEMQKLIYTTVSFNLQSRTFIDTCKTDILSLKHVSDKFKPQIIRLIQEDNKEMLHQRLEASAGYFTPRLKEMADKLSKSPIRSKNKEDAGELLPLLKDLYLTLQQKIHLTQAIAKEADVKTYLNAKQSFTCPPMEVKAIYDRPKKKSISKNVKSR